MDMKNYPWYKRWFKKPTLAELVTICDYPHEVCWFVRRWISTRPDPASRDLWRPAEVTWHIGAGDCEDIAVLVWDVCRRLGYDCVVDVYFTIAPPRGHAVAQGRCWFADLGEFHPVNVGAGEDASIAGCREQAKNHVSDAWFSGAHVFRREVSEKEINDLVKGQV